MLHRRPRLQRDARQGRALGAGGDMLHAHAVASLRNSPCSLLVDAHDLMCIYTCMRCTVAGREARTARGDPPARHAGARTRRGTTEYSVNKASLRTKDKPVPPLIQQAVY